MQEQKITTPDLEITMKGGMIYLVFGTRSDGDTYTLPLQMLKEMIQEELGPKQDRPVKGFDNGGSMDIPLKPTSAGHSGQKTSGSYKDEWTG